MSVIKYPGAIDDNTSLPPTTDGVTAVSASVVNTLRGAIIAIEQELGAEPSGIYGSVRARLDAINAVIDALTLGIAVPTGTVGGDLSGSLPNPNVVDLTITGQTQGSILYFNGTNWVQLSPSTDGLVLTTHGSGANPTWAVSQTSLASSAPANVTKAAATVGVGTSAARADHKHDVSTAAALSVGTANAEGTATTLARSDHTHNVTNFNIASQVQGSILYYNGTSWVQLAPGTDGYFLTTHSTGQNPTWTASNVVVQASVGLITDWYVNASTGSDSNDGKTSLTAFRTSEKLCQVLCPGGNRYIPQQNVVIHFSAGSYGELFLRGSFAASIALYAMSVIIVCEISSSPSITLSSVVDTVPGTSGVRGQLTTVGSTAFTTNARITSTSGANIGAVTYSTGQNANTKNHFVKEWFNYDTSLVLANIASGTTCRVDTLLVSFKRIDVEFEGPGYFELSDAKLSGEINIQTHSYGGTVNIRGCEYTGNTAFSVGEIYGYCLWVNCNFIAGEAEFCQQFPSLFGCVVQQGATISTFPGSELEFFGGNCFNGGKLAAKQPSASLIIKGNIEFCNGSSGVAFDIQEGALAVSRASLWGASTNYDVGVHLGSMCKLTIPTATSISIPATIQVQMMGNNLNYSNIPINYPNSSCAIVLNSDANSTPYISIPGQTQGDALYFNGTSWVKLAAGTDGYFLQTHGSGNNPTWAAAIGSTINNWYIADWYINASTGTDSNNGLTSGTALKTIEELNNRLCPGGDAAFLKQATTIHVAAGTYGKLYLDIASNTITISCAITSTSNIITNSITNSSASGLIRGEIETASGTFIDYGRIRITSGANTGAVAFSTGLNGSAAQTFTTAFMDSSGVQVNITNGNNVVVDTYTVSFSNVILFATNASTITVNNAIIFDTNATSGVIFNSCNTSSGAVLLGGGTYRFCSFLNATLSSGDYKGYGNQFINSCSSIYSNFTFTGITVFDDCNSFIGQDVTLNIVTAELIRRNNTAGFIIPSGSSVISTGYLWSGTGAYANTAVQMNPGSYFSFGILPTVSALNNITIAGVGFTWAQLPQKVGSTSAEYNVIYTSAANDVSYWTGNYWARLPASTDGYVLTTHGTSTAPNWLPAAASNLNIVGQAQGDILYFNGSVWTKLSASTDGYVLTTHSVNQNPTWSGFSTILGSALTGQTLIYNGSWIAGGNGNLGDNYFSSQNLKTDGYVACNSILFPRAITGVSISQNPKLTISTDANNLTVSAQNASGVNSRGGNLILSSGTGTSAQGASDGYVFINRGSQTVASWNTGNTFVPGTGTSDDYISFGKNTPTSGNIRFATSSAIYGRNAANSTDVSLLFWGTSGIDALNIGGSGVVATSLFGGTLNLSATSSANLNIGGNQIWNTSSTSFQINTNSVLFLGSLITAPTIKVFDDPTVSITGVTLTLQGRNATGSNSRGGSLQLSSGTGTSAQGAPDGYVFINRGSQIIANWNTGTDDDFITFGKIAATVGNIRLTPSLATLSKSGIFARNVANTGDINIIAYTPNSGAITINDGGINSASTTQVNNINIYAPGIFTLANATTSVIVTPSLFSISQPTFSFDRSVASPVIFHGDRTSDGNSGTTLTLRSQSCLGANTLGGTLALASGTGVPNNLGVNASDGYITISRGNNIVANWGDGYSDYISLGSRFNPASTTGNIRLAKNGFINFRNSTNSGDIQAIYTSSASMVINGETLAGGVSLAGAGSNLMTIGATGSQTVLSIIDSTTSIIQFTGGAGLSQATLQIHSTTATTGVNLVVSGQPANVNGGNLYLVSGNSTLGTGPQGRVSIGIGGYINGITSGVGIQMIELTNLGTSNTPLGILGLLNTNALTTTQMPANTGNGVIYIANATTTPTANSVGGGIFYVESGALKYRGTSGTITVLGPA